jgi:hypothetical protein
MSEADCGAWGAHAWRLVVSCDTLEQNALLFVSVVVSLPFTYARYCRSMIGRLRHRLRQLRLHALVL